MVSGVPRPPLIPAVPRGVSAVSSGTTNVISWTPVDYATGYKVYWGTASGVTPANPEPLASESSPIIHSGLSSGTTYYYVVSSIGPGGGVSSVSAEVHAP